MKITFSILFCCFVFLLKAQYEVIPLYSDNTPCLPAHKIERLYDNRRQLIRAVDAPEMWFFPADSHSENKPAVMVIPGGGYGGLSYEREGIQVAEWLNPLGISVFVLIHRLPSPSYGDCQSKVPLVDAFTALRLIRENAKKWKIDATKIGVMGFSAGGHLAATLSTQYDSQHIFPENNEQQISARPDFSILIYPVITMKLPFTHKGSRDNLLGPNPSKENVLQYSNELHITSQTPPTLLIHAADDKAVVQHNSMHYYLALQENKVPSALHIWESGGHGFGMLGGKGSIRFWPEITKDWLIQRGILDADL